MKRCSWSVGKHGTCFGNDVPEWAIWRVIHTGLPCAAATIFLVTSPTTLMSVLALDAWLDGGFEIGKMSAAVTSNALTYGFNFATASGTPPSLTTGPLPPPFFFGGLIRGACTSTRG